MSLWHRLWFASPCLPVHSTARQIPPGRPVPISDPQRCLVLASACTQHTTEQKREPGLSLALNVSPERPFLSPVSCAAHALSRAITLTIMKAPRHGPTILSALPTRIKERARDRERNAPQDASTGRGQTAHHTQGMAARARHTPPLRSEPVTAGAQ